MVATDTTIILDEPLKINHRMPMLVEQKRNFEFPVYKKKIIALLENSSQKPLSLNINPPYFNVDGREGKELGNQLSPPLLSSQVSPSASSSSSSSSSLLSPDESKTLSLTLPVSCPYNTSSMSPCNNDDDDDVIVLDVIKTCDKSPDEDTSGQSKLGVPNTIFSSATVKSQLHSHSTKNGIPERRPHSKSRTKERSTSDGHILCKICGDKASGFHYGVFSCEGCKGFFRRTVRQKLEYKPCDNPKGCLIMRISRNRCQYCRIQRCIMSGMSHEAVRLGRCPKKDKPKRLDFFRLPQNQQGKVDIDKQIKSEQMVLTIHDAFRSAMKSIISSNTSYFKQKTVIQGEDDARKICCHYMTDIVRFISMFAREIPHFKQLSMSNQRNLIKSSILETILVHAVSTGVLDDVTVEDSVSLNPENKENSNDNMAPLTNLLRDISTTVLKLKKLELNDVELSILAAILLFCPDRPDVENSSFLEKMESELCLALKCQFLLNHSMNKTLLFPKTVEVIVDIRAITTKYLDDIMNAQVEVDDSAP